ncbi:MAG: hypothetical protein ACR2PL_21330 [Dehalococcoidia bacterium]
MTYNGDGTTTNYRWDQAGGLAQILDDGTQYVPGLGAGALGQITGRSTYYFLPDALGSTIAIVDSTGTVQQTYTYDAFGKATAGINNRPTEFLFGSQQTDPRGFQVLRARYYDPSMAFPRSVQR